MSERYANNFSTTLAVACDADDLTLSVVSAAPAALQGGQFRIVIDAELLLVTAGQGTTTWTVTRGIEGTAAAIHALGSVVAHVLTAAGLPRAENLLPLRADATAAEAVAKVNALLAAMKARSVMLPDDTSYRDLIMGMGPTSYWRLGEPVGTIAYDEVTTTAALSDDFTVKANGTIVTPDTGPDTWALIASDAESALRVIGGKLTNVTTAATPRAGYASMTMGGNVRHIGARFTLSPTTNPGGGVACIAIWKTPLTNLASIPDSPLHLVISDISWAASKWTGGTPTALAGGGATFAVPLASDGVTVHEVTVTIYGTTLVIDFPDGSTYSVTDAAIGTNAGPEACFEIYQSNASTDTRAAYTEVWANSTPGVNDGTIVDAPVLGALGALVGDADGAITFASGDSIAADAAPSDLTDFSLAFWVRRNDAADVHLGYAGGATGWLYWKIETDHDRIHVGITTNGGAYSDHYSQNPGGGQFNDTAWHHVVIRRLGTAISFVVDGVGFPSPTPTGDAGIIGMGTAFRISAQAFAGGVSTETLDEVALFGRALSDDECRTLYERGSGLKAAT